MERKVIFTKLFTRGNLRGLTVSDSLNFVNIWAALDWLRGVRRNVREGRLDYVLMSARVVPS